VSQGKLTFCRLAASGHFRKWPVLCQLPYHSALRAVKLWGSRMSRIERFGAVHTFCYAAGMTLALIGASVALATGDQTAKPVWPHNGVAQRMLPGAYTMFVEHDDHGQWHAWVMNGEEDAEALDFFSGKVIHVKADMDDHGQQSRFFTDPSGGVHGTLDKGFEFSLTGAGGLPGGISFAGGLQSLRGTNCSTSFIGIKGGVSEDDPMEEHPKWTKVPIYRVAANTFRGTSCKNAKLEGGVNTGLDLEDGTFLITEGCWVFRLRKSDLSPVGAAPGLRLVDKAALQAAIDQAKGKDIQDASAYLAKALNLSFDAANSCKAD
jgi:hypothetical protein